MESDENGQVALQHTNLSLTITQNGGKIALQVVENKFIEDELYYRLLATEIILGMMIMV